MSLRERLGESWYQLLKGEFKKDYFKRIPAILKKERKKYTIYPESKDVFNAYKLTPYNKARVILIGQDPYYNAHQAHGLSFSINDDEIDTPPSLKNIQEEIERDLDKLNLCWSNDLTSWAKQGVFLLNRSLTVREGKSGSHRKIGWKRFTNKTIKVLNSSPVPTVFMLWGNDAQELEQYIDSDHHLVLKASHPSPLAAYRSFNGCSHFSKCNNFLKKNNLEPINWITEI